MSIRIGIGGWTFAPWRGAFYPKGLPHAQELRYAAEHLSSIEINGTFYRTQTPSSFAKWTAETPQDFVFSLKGPRYATQRKPLADAAPSIERFYKSGPLVLGDKLGPVLWQFAPFFKFDPDDFAAFLKLLPKELDGRKLRHVVEARHASFADPKYLELLREHGVAHAIIESDKHQLIEDVTADFVYLRLELSQDDEATGYAKQDLDRWAKRIKTWAAGQEPEDATRLSSERAPKAKARDCFVYFISGAKVRNPAAAMAMMDRLK